MRRSCCCRSRCSDSGCGAEADARSLPSGPALTRSAAILVTLRLNLALNFGSSFVQNMVSVLKELLKNLPLRVLTGRMSSSTRLSWVSSIYSIFLSFWQMMSIISQGLFYWTWNLV
ncbi:uncharacterized protein LOC125488374 isoform X4 [Rhincodon typus]|uniref:uncharacterized protein LOC125488374 isoform X4 n=1 Tax=Rhincodon typus TaxID=259920 RepID=UPI00202F1A88|nr:uncharacterized protein LOC125488374 isoform X4 [Rhincodon typus]